VRLRPVSLLASAALLLTLTAPVAAVIDGTPDGNLHPYVGGLVTNLGTEAKPDWLLLCSGTMVSPTVFVTAAHCTDLLEENDLPAFVTLDSEFDYLDPGTLYSGTMYTHPQYGVSFPDTFDIAVVELDGVGVSLADYADLPTVGYLDTLSRQRGHKDLTLTAVGYGATGFLQKGINSVQVYDDIRRFTTVKFIGLRGGYSDGWNLKHSGNQGQDRSATCYGDSGGPVLEGSTLVAVTSFGIDPNCAGPGYTWRVDLQESLDFINGGYAG
jgi:hypothetical protein